MIRNKTRDTVLGRNVTLCDTHLSRTRGLMFRLPLKAGHAYLFPFEPPQRPWIHMLFVFFPIDIIFLDDKSKATYLVESARPFQLRITPPVPISALIELPVGTITKSKTKLGDSIQIGA